MGVPRQHHILPEFYLAGFTNTGTRKGYLHVFDYKRAKCFRAKPKDVAIERDFYRIYEPNYDQNAVEHELAQVESKTAPVLANVRKSRIFRNGEELGNILSLVALIHARGKWARERISSSAQNTMWNKLRKGEVTPEQWENLRQSELRAGVSPAVLPNFKEARQLVFNPKWRPKAPEVLKVGVISEIQQEIFKWLAGRIWSLALAEPGFGGFICSDSPLAWGNKMPWEVGVEWERLDDPHSTITFPLSSELALITRPDCQGTYKAEATVIAWVNIRTQFTSKGSLISSSPNFFLMRKGGAIGRSQDYFTYVRLARAAGFHHP